MADIGHEQLTAFWKQPTNQYGSYELYDNHATYREQWKGSMTNILRLYNKIQSWKPTTPTESYVYAKFKLDAASIAPLSAYYDPPTTPVSSDWSLENAEVQEADAGDNAVLDLTWGVNTVTVSEGGQEEYLLDWHDHWSLSWQSQSYTLYAYCGNTGDHIDDADDRGMMGKIASRTAIESWFNQSQEYQNLKFTKQYSDGPVVNKKLNGAERNIADKILQGKSNPIFHYPIVTRTSTAEYSLNDQDKAMSAISERLASPDVIDDPLIPFRPIPLYPGMYGWQWLCQGSNVSTAEDPRSKKVTVTVTTSWWGAAEWDVNFYGDEDERWLFGQA